jgi:aminodeoxyfutalosine deaminase
MRKLDAEAAFAAILAEARRARERGLRLQWIPDGTWQFGPAAALEVARVAARLKNEGVVAFGMGGDELALPFDQFVPAYEFAAAQGLHRTVHAGEIGTPTHVMHAIEPLLAERIGHGLAVCRDTGVLEWLCAWKIPLEVCPTSNLRTGALARQLSLPAPGIEKHPLKLFFDRGAIIALSSDDPAMFGTTLLEEYGVVRRLGFDLQQTMRIMEMSFEAAFLPAEEKQSYLAAFEAKKKELGLV